MVSSKRRSAAAKKSVLPEVLEAGACRADASEAREPLQRVAWFCVCGAALEISVMPRVAAQVEEAWRRVHSGPRHRPVPAPVRDPLRHTDQLLADVAETAARARSKRAGGDP